MIYCVEDERNIRELIVYTLESSGFTARGLESGKELNAAIAEQLPDLILLDIMLPGEDGLEILSRLKASEVTKEIPVIMVTAKGAEYDKVIGMGSGDTPDVMYMWNYPAYADGLEPLDEYIDKEGDDYKNDFYSTLWNYNSLDGTTYGIPVGFTTHSLFYNKDLFAQAGVEEPTDDWTWSDLQAAAKTIEEKTGQKGFAFQMKPDPYDFEMYLWSNGTAYCDEDGQMAGQIDSKESQEVFKMFQDMEKDGYAIATEKNGTDEFRLWCLKHRFTMSKA